MAPPADTGSEEQIAAGRALYERFCGGCHGFQAVSGGVLPDLRSSPLNAETSAWQSVVLDGALADKGMVSFAAVLNEAETDAIRMYVIRRAHEQAKSE